MRVSIILLPLLAAAPASPLAERTDSAINAPRIDSAVAKNDEQTRAVLDRIDARALGLARRMSVEEEAGMLFDKSAAVPRLGIPAYQWWNEALHGVARAGRATVFPQAIGLAATWDAPLMRRVARAIADEGRAKHEAFAAAGVGAMYTGLTFWSPNINIFRDPRWGRGQETYGEDPFLTGTMATAFVRGLQGDDPVRYRTIATIKHFAVHSGPEGTRHSADVEPSPRDLEDTYLRAFGMVVRDAAPASVMCAYNAVDGAPACASRPLLEDTLRRRWGFRGYVVSDCGALADIWKRDAHAYAPDRAAAAAAALAVGTDLECGDGDGSVFAALPGAVALGLVPRATVDRAVARLLAARMRVGLLPGAGPDPYAGVPSSVVGSPAHRALALEAARRSLVLLGNDGVLPLRPGARVALIGPNAGNPDVLIGNYNGRPVAPVTLAEAMLRRRGVVAHPGGPLAADVWGWYDTVPAALLSHVESGRRVPGLAVGYWPTPAMAGPPARTAVSHGVDEVWTRSPADGRPDAEFAARWTGEVTPPRTGRYRFAPGLVVRVAGRAVGDAGVRLEAGRAYPIEAVLRVERAWHSNAVEPTARLAWVDLDRDWAGEAVAAAAKADVIVYAAGISSRLEGEEMPLRIDGFSGGDRTDLSLPAPQRELLARLASMGKPLVVVDFSGGAIDLRWARDHAAAIVQAFYPGEASGDAVDDLLYGAFSPSGRLPVTFYGGVGDLPPFGSYAMSGRTYRYYRGEPVYSFGDGLGFARLRYVALRVAPVHRPGGPLRASVEIANDGRIRAEEVVQLYLSRPGVADAPLRSLVAFTRVSLRPGERRLVTLDISDDGLTEVDARGLRRPIVGDVVVTARTGVPGAAGRKLDLARTVRLAP